MRVSLLATCSAIAVTLAVFSGYASGQTQTTYTTETSNNTSACGSGAKESHCTATGNTYGPGSNGFSSTSGTYIPEPGNVSHANIHPLITGFNANSPGAPLVFVHYLPWFCTTSSPTCNGHVLTGYASNSTTTVTNQLNDIASRGFDGIVVNWYGKPTGTPNSSCPNGPVHCLEDETTKKIIAAAASTNLKIVLNYDQGSFGQQQRRCLYRKPHFYRLHLCQYYLLRPPPLPSVWQPSCTPDICGGNAVFWKLHQQRAMHARDGSPLHQYSRLLAKNLD